MVDSLAPFSVADDEVSSVSTDRARIVAVELGAAALLAVACSSPSAAPSTTAIVVALVHFGPRLHQLQGSGTVVVAAVQQLQGALLVEMLGALNHRVTEDTQASSVSPLLQDRFVLFSFFLYFLLYSVDGLSKCGGRTS